MVRIDNNIQTDLSFKSRGVLTLFRELTIEKAVVVHMPAEKLSEMEQNAGL